MVLLPAEGASRCKGLRSVSARLPVWTGNADEGGSGGVSVRGYREREGPVAGGRPLAQMSPGRVAASSFILPRSLPPATGLGARDAGGRPAFLALVGGSGAGPPCPWRRNKGGGGGRRPTPEDIRRKGHGGPAPDPPTSARKSQMTLLLAPDMGEEPHMPSAVTSVAPDPPGRTGWPCAPARCCRGCPSSRTGAPCACSPSWHSGSAAWRCLPGAGPG
jgi:hypothetical protein